MDYMDQKILDFIRSADVFFNSKKNQRIILMTTKASVSYTNFKFHNK